MAADQDIEPPKPDIRDTVHMMVRAGLGTIPVAGSPAVQAFTHLFAPPIDRRRQEWMEAVWRGIEDLRENQGVKLEDLQENPVFVDTVLQASHAALKTSSEEKRQALRNAILNAVLPEAPEASLQQVFLGFVDEFTEWHLLILKLFNDPKAWAKARKHVFPQNLLGGTLEDVLLSAFPALREERFLYDQIWKDLQAAGLVNSPSLHVMATASGMFENRTTEMGRRFIAFIEAPTFSPLA